MNEFLIILLSALAVFGLMAAGLALREYRHPSRRGEEAGGCIHANPKIKCLQCPSRAAAEEGGSQP